MHVLACSDGGAVVAASVLSATALAQPAAGSVVSYRTLAQAPPDGYTLLGVTGGFTIAPAVHANLGYDPVKDLASI